MALQCRTWCLLVKCVLVYLIEETSLVHVILLNSSCFCLSVSIFSWVNGAAKANKPCEPSGPSAHLQHKTLCRRQSLAHNTQYVSGGANSGSQWASSATKSAVQLGKFGKTLSKMNHFCWKHKLLSSTQLMLLGWSKYRWTAISKLISVLDFCTTFPSLTRHSAQLFGWINTMKTNKWISRNLNANTKLFYWLNTQSSVRQ